MTGVERSSTSFVGVKRGGKCELKLQRASAPGGYLKARTGREVDKKSECARDVCCPMCHALLPCDVSVQMPNGKSDGWRGREGRRSEAELRRLTSVHCAD